MSYTDLHGGALRLFLFAIPYRVPSPSFSEGRGAEVIDETPPHLRNQELSSRKAVRACLLCLACASWVHDAGGPRMSGVYRLVPWGRIFPVPQRVRRQT